MPLGNLFYNLPMKGDPEKPCEISRSVLTCIPLLFIGKLDPEASREPFLHTASQIRAAQPSFA
jgi:hypothetical protein